jgi:hypothetical protein
MKTSSSIITFISSQPQFRLLATHICYGKFLALLPPRFRSSIAYIFFKDSTLYFAITHPGMKMELNYNLDLFKSILAIIDREDSSCSFPKIDKLMTFIPKYNQQIKLDNQKETETTVPYYSEKSTADFDAHSLDEELQQAYENIKKAILCNQS